MDKKIEAAIRETLVIGNPVSIKRCVDKLKLIFEQEQALRQANVSGSLPLVSREELISLLEDKRICKMSDLPADIYYLSRKETADYLMDNYMVTKRQ